uniref:NADH-ubiquinone oxidoreductase chain 5 n=1 Tax=Dryinus sp. ZJUH_2016011 TaxID=2491175 RepID=A0A3Q8U9N6_9HYME|nr:NADH dehydrogenase subunit 5 [Dryinus sp. ZJUH_2016011]
MIKMIIQSFILLLLSIFFFFYSLFFKMKNFMMLLEWNLCFMNSIDYSYILYFDWVSLSFISIVFFISSMIMCYSVEYMNYDKFINRFFYLIYMFIMSMMLMILSPNILSILLGWDGLGLVSYCLVIYYQSVSSCNSGMVTVLMNRVGDIGLLMSIGLLVSLGSFNLMSYFNINVLIVLMLVLSGFSKSAQIPFSSWLPMAMSAPTPVSSLVHSSTLVTAGVYLFIRYYYLICNSKLNMILLLLVSLTMLMSGLMANLEMDMKKIIALSTLSQLSLMMSILFLGFNELSYFHLLIHALFKSLLFMCSGIIIHLMNNNQDIRFMGGLINLSPFLIMVFMMAKLCLCGFPFLSGFYSKDLIMELILMSKMNLLILMILLLSILLTVSYSVRMIMFMFIMNFKFKCSFMFNENWLMNNTLFLNYFFSIIGGFSFNWLYFKFNFIVILNFYMKIMVLMFCFLGILVGIYFYYKSLKFYYFLSSLWFLDYIIKYINMFFLNIGMLLFMNIEKGWLENYSGVGFILFFKSFKKKLKSFIFLTVGIYFMTILLMMMMLYY